MGHAKICNLLRLVSDRVRSGWGARQAQEPSWKGQQDGAFLQVQKFAHGRAGKNQADKEKRFRNDRNRSEYLS